MCLRVRPRNVINFQHQAHAYARAARMVCCVLIRYALRPAASSVRAVGGWYTSMGATTKNTVFSAVTQETRRTRSTLSPSKSSPDGVFTNSANVNIPDYGDWVSSDIQVTGRSRNDRP